MLRQIEGNFIRDNLFTVLAAQRYFNDNLYIVGILTAPSTQDRRNNRECILQNLCIYNSSVKYAEAGKHYILYCSHDNSNHDLNTFMFIEHHFDST